MTNRDDLAFSTDRMIKRPISGSPRTPRREGLVTVLLLAPLVLFMLLVFVYPLGLTVVNSFRTGAKSPFAFYVNIFNNPSTRDIIYLTLGLAIASTILSLVLSFGLAVALSKTQRWRKLLTYLMLIPATVPALVGTLGLLIFYGQAGWINVALLHLHVISTPLTIDYSLPGMVLFYTWMFFPFGGLIIVSGLQSLDPMVEEAAQLCGATRIQVFFRVTIPLLATNIVTATILIFLQAFGAFSIPLIAGGNHHPLAVQIFTVATVFLQWHRASALAVVMGGIQIILLSLNGWLSRRGRYASTTTR